jgi:hypothetical protein
VEGLPIRCFLSSRHARRPGCFSTDVSADSFHVGLCQTVSSCPARVRKVAASAAMSAAACRIFFTALFIAAGAAPTALNEPVVFRSSAFLSSRLGKVIIFRPAAGWPHRQRYAAPDAKSFALDAALWEVMPSRPRPLGKLSNSARSPFGNQCQVNRRPDDF